MSGDERKGVDVSSCEGCGACCREQESPPGYVAILCGMDWPGEGDVERVRTMPVELLAELRRSMLDGCRHAELPACLWYDAETRRCRHYEWRPSVCREFAEGSDECAGWRELYQIEMPCTGWNVALTDAEVASLAAGFHPQLVRPAALVSLCPFGGLTGDRRPGGAE